MVEKIRVSTETILYLLTEGTRQGQRLLPLHRRCFGEAEIETIKVLSLRKRRKGMEGTYTLSVQFEV